METKDIAVAIAIGISVGCGMVLVYAWFVYRDLKNRIDQMIAEIVAEHEASLVGLHIEIDNGTYFCYNNEDKQFICQGTTVGEIAVAFRNRYPGKTAYLAGGSPEVLDKFKAELEKMRSEVDEASTSQ